VIMVASVLSPDRMDSARRAAPLGKA